MNKADKQNEKTPIAASKSFMTAGPTLHYSHKNVVRCWVLAFFVFALCCIFWSKILSGDFWSFDFQTVISPNLWHLGQSTITGVSIFEYPWQISVLGLLMGILAIVPVLMSQLMSFSYALPFIAVLIFLANLPGFALSVLLGCFAAACRPLRFRSRFVAIALCTLPQLVYWGYFGSAWGIEPVKLGFSFAPWICAWLTSLAIAGGVLGIGHYTRYKPGLIWIFTSIVLVIAVGTFEITIGFGDLDYQLYVAKNNPEMAEEFHQHSIEEALDKTITNPSARVKRYFESSFYPTEPIPLRVALKEKIQSQLALDLWPNWFTVPTELRFQEKRQWLFKQYDLFINRRPASPRMPIALYYKAILSEYRPDIKALGQKEILRFYNDYPYERSQDLWYWLYTDFGDSPESIEARWRIARVYAGQGEFETAEKLLETAQIMAEKHRAKLLLKEKKEVQRLFSPFCPPADSAITISKLDELERRIKLLRSLIGPENRNGKKASKQNLAEFIMLNPYDLQFERHLDDLLEKTGSKDGLRDNILLAKAKLIADQQLRSEKLSRLHNEFKNTDGGMQALYELGLLKIRSWNKKDDANTDQKNKALAEARLTLAEFIKLYPDSIFTSQVSKNLADLPTTE
jgi:hypothetical protein